MGRKLTARQKLFVEHLLADPEMRPSVAAREAGYSKATARSKAHTFLNIPVVKEFYAEAIIERNERLGIDLKADQDRVMNELQILAFSDMKDYVGYGPVGVTLKEMMDLPEGASRAISEVSQNLSADGSQLLIEVLPSDHLLNF